jgi:ribonuclease HI
LGTSLLPVDTALDFVIYKDREEAKALVPDLNSTIYTDGSVRNGLVGIGVVWRRAPENRSAQHERERALPRDWNVIQETVARQEDSNEYVAELLAIQRALQLLVEEPVIPGEVTICTDCQAAITSIQRPHQQSGQYAIQAILQAASQLRDRGVKIRLYWVPAHQGVEGNELANKYARLATRKQGNLTPNIERQVRLRSTALRIGREAILRDTAPTQCLGKQLKRIDKALPQKHMVKAYNTMSCEDTRILVQLRTGHIGLNCYLKRVGKAEHPTCACGLGEESIFHFLFQCPTWAEQRQNLRTAMGNRWADLSYALGGWNDRREPTGELIDGRKDKWKPKLDILKAVVQFTKATGRLIGPAQGVAGVAADPVQGVVVGPAQGVAGVAGLARGNSG